MLAPVADLVRMKLTSYRLKDQVHIQDLDSVGLITPVIEESLPDLLRDRLVRGGLVLLQKLLHLILQRLVLILPQGLPRLFRQRIPIWQQVQVIIPCGCGT